MKNLKTLLSFSDVAKELGCKSSDVLSLVVEEKRLPAILVTLAGGREPYGLQVMNVGATGAAFDLAQGFDGAVHTGNLRVERVALDRFMEEVGIESATASPKSKKAGSTVMDEKVHPRERTTFLNIIGVLLELIGTPIPGRNIEEKLIKEMVANYSDKQGIAPRTLQDKFAEAKRSLLND